MKLHISTHKALVDGKEYPARKSGNNWYFYSIKATRWIPVSKNNIINAD